MNDNTLELNERAFTFFVEEGLQYYRRNNHQFRLYSAYNYIHSLYHQWTDMNEQQKEPYLESAREDMRRNQERRENFEPFARALHVARREPQ